MNISDRIISYSSMVLKYYTSLIGAAEVWKTDRRICGKFYFILGIFQLFSYTIFKLNKHTFLLKYISNYMKLFWILIAWVSPKLLVAN